MKFCFICGKKTENLIKGYCEECYNKKFKLIEVPEEINITLCGRCNKIKKENKWEDIEIDEFLRNKIKVLGKNVKIKFEINDIAKVYAKGFLEGSKKPKEENYEVKLKINKVTCLECSRKSGRYYEVVIQIRGDLTNDVFDLIDDIAIRENGFYRIEEVKDGYDLFVSGKSLANKIIGLLSEKYKVKIKKSFKLVTNKEGKGIYRNTVLVSITSD
jgi:nonsense-mediated mRNA decay protein 3